MSIKEILHSIAIVIGTVVICTTIIKATPPVYSHVEKPLVQIDTKYIKLELAKTIMEQAQGLSNRKLMDEGSGMLFVFNEKQKRSFWMKDMNFALDIVFIEDDTIVQIERNVRPEGSMPQNRYVSLKPVNYVLELNGNFCLRNSIKVGDKVRFDLD